MVRGNLFWKIHPTFEGYWKKKKCRKDYKYLADQDPSVLILVFASPKTAGAFQFILTSTSHLLQEQSHAAGRHRTKNMNKPECNINASQHLNSVASNGMMAEASISRRGASPLRLRLGGDVRQSIVTGAGSSKEQLLPPLPPSSRPLAVLTKLSVVASGRNYMTVHLRLIGLTTMRRGRVTHWPLRGASPADSKGGVPRLKFSPWICEEQRQELRCQGKYQTWVSVHGTKTRADVCT